MATNRIELLTQMLASDPNNTFARYGLAMEYSKAGNYREAISEFQTLFSTDPDYVAGYFHAGQTYEKLGDLDRAKATYEQGIEVSSRKGDTHTRAEIEAALSLLPV